MRPSVALTVPGAIPKLPRGFIREDFMRVLLGLGASLLLLTAASTGRAADDTAAKVQAADAAKGAQVFKMYCETCHGPTGRSARP